MPPTKSSTAEPSAKPDPAPPPAPKADFAAFDAAIDALPADPDTTPDVPAKAAPEPKAEEAEPAQETPPPAEEPSATSLGEDLDGLLKKPAAAKPVEPVPDDKRPPKALRDELSRVKSELTKQSTLAKELEAKVAKAIEEGRRAAETELQAKLEKLAAEREELATQVRYLNYAESAEYKEKYLTPYRAALKAANEEIEGMTVETVDGASRPLTIEDVMGIVDLPAADARRRANELFGPAAADVMRHRAKLRETADAARSAIKEWKEKGSKLQEDQASELESAQKEFGTAIDSRIKELGELAPDIFGENGKDPELAGYTSKARQIVDIALGRAQPRAGTSTRESALARAKAIGDLAAAKVALPRVLHERNKFKADLDAALERLKAYEASEPEPSGGDAKQKKSDNPLDYEAAIDALPADG